MVEASEAQAADSGSSEAQVAQTFIDDGGKFLPGWKEHYVPEALRSDEVYGTFGDVGGALTMLGNLQGMIGKKGVIKPGEASPPSEWDNFHREMGRPDTKDLYNIKAPDDLAEVYDKNVMAKARDVFFGLGLDQKKVDALMALEEERTRAGLAAVEAQKLEADNTFKEWGVTNPDKMHWANRMIAENCNDDDHKTALLEALDNNTAFAELLFNVSAKFKEHKVISDTEQPIGMSPGDALAEAKKVESTPGFILPDDKGQFMRDVNRPEYERLEKERTKYYQLANVKPG